MSQSDQVHQHSDTVGIQEQLDVGLVMEELVNEHQEAVPLRLVHTLSCECHVRFTMYT